MTEKNQKIHSIFLSANYENVEFDLEDLATLLGAQYDDSVFPGLVYRSEDCQVTFLIFESGKVNCVGAKTLEEAEKAVETFTEELQRSGVEFEKEPETEVKNIVASVNFGEEFDLKMIAKKFQDAGFEPEKFPGLVYRSERGEAVFLLYRSGKGVCVGAKSNASIEKATEEISKIQKEIRFEKLRNQLNASPLKRDIPREYLEWNELLAQEFYSRDQSGHSAFLNIDEHKIEQLESKTEESLPGFQEAVRSLGTPDRIINILLSMGVTWGRKREETPPFISGLGLCVLAASKMGTDPEIPSHNYYHWLNAELGRKKKGRPPGFEKMHLLWKMLNYWLEVECGGERGNPTSRQVGGYKHVGWPLSQALIRQEADKKELLDLKDWLGVKEKSMDHEEVAQGLSIWLDQEGADSRLASLFRGDPTAEDLDFVAEQLIDVLPELEYDQEIKTKSKTQDKSAYLHLHQKYQDWKDVEIHLVWRAEEIEPGEYKATLDPPGKEVDLRVLSDWADIKLDLSEVELGSLIAEPKDFEQKARLKLDTENPIMFVQGETHGRPGWWIQSDQVKGTEEKRCVLCKEEKTEEVAGLLSQEMDEVEPKTELDWIPKGFVFYPEIRLDKDHTGKKLISWDLNEGLRIEKNVWLKGMLPKLQASEELEVTIQDKDGNKIGEGVTPFSLGKLELSEGSYELKPSKGKSKRIVVRSPTWPPFPTLSTETEFKQLEIRSPINGDEINLSGAYVKDAENIPNPPILNGQTPAVLLGKTPGEFKRISGNFGGKNQEKTEINFEPQWKINIMDDKPFLVDSMKQEPDPSELAKSEKGKEKWVNYISEEINTNLLTAGQREIFEKYTQAAEKVKESKEGIIYVGSKPVWNYVKAVFIEIREGHEEIVLKARGRAISTAVATAEILKNRLSDIEVKAIETDTEESEDKNGKSSVSKIIIKLGEYKDGTYVKNKESENQDG